MEREAKVFLGERIVCVKAQGWKGGGLLRSTQRQDGNILSIADVAGQSTSQAPS